MIWFTSDNHYGHKNIIKYCDRPFETVEEMDAKLIANHNACVQPTDEVWFLGDFSFYKKKEQLFTILEQLNGRKHLVLGNHDEVIIKNRDLFGHYFASIQDYKELTVEIQPFVRQKIVLFHYGCRVWNGSHHGSWHLYGHSHGTLPPYGLSVDVGVDSKAITNEYRPVSLDEVSLFICS